MHDSANQPIDYLVIKTTHKVKKYGINWLFGDLADFKLPSDAALSN